MPHVHNGLHEYNRLLDGAARAIGEKSGAQDFTGIERFGETLTPTMDLWALPEWALLRGEIIFSRHLFVAANAALFSSLELVNPTGGTTLAVVLQIACLGNLIQTNVDSGAAVGALATNRGLANDCRHPSLGEVSACALVSGHVAAGAALPQCAIPATSGLSTWPYIVPPGKRLFIAGTAINTSISVAILWTERPLLPTEERA